MHEVDGLKILDQIDPEGDIFRRIAGAILSDGPPGANPDNQKLPDNFDEWSDEKREEWIDGIARCTYMSQCAHLEQIRKDSRRALADLIEKAVNLEDAHKAAIYDAFMSDGYDSWAEVGIFSTAELAIAACQKEMSEDLGSYTSFYFDNLTNNERTRAVDGKPWYQHPDDFDYHGHVWSVTQIEVDTNVRTIIWDSKDGYSNG